MNSTFDLSPPSTTPPHSLSSFSCTPTRGSVARDAYGSLAAADSYAAAASASPRGIMSSSPVMASSSPRQDSLTDITELLFQRTQNLLRFLVILSYKGVQCEKALCIYSRGVQRKSPGGANIEIKYPFSVRLCVYTIWQIARKMLFLTSTCDICLSPLKFLKTSLYLFIELF